MVDTLKSSGQKRPNNPHPGFALLLSDDLYVVGALASDTRSLWRSLASSEQVRRVAAELASDPNRIRALVSFIRAQVLENHELTYRHPNDIAVCAALVILQDSPLSEVRRLFYELRRIASPSLAWVARMAAYCDDRFCRTAVNVLRVKAQTDPITPIALVNNWSRGPSLKTSLESEHETTANEIIFLIAQPLLASGREAALVS